MEQIFDKTCMLRTKAHFILREVVFNTLLL